MVADSGMEFRTQTVPVGYEFPANPWGFRTKLVVMFGNGLKTVTTIVTRGGTIRWFCLDFWRLRCRVIRGGFLG